MMPVRLEPPALQSLVKHSTTEPLRSPSFNNTGEQKLDSIHHTLHHKLLNLFEITFLARAFQDFAPYMQLCSESRYYWFINFGNWV